MSPASKKPTIEGLTPPAASTVNVQREVSAPGSDLEVMRSLRMHPRLAAWVAGGVFVLMVGLALSRKPMYLAESLTYVEPGTSKILSDGSAGAFDPSRYDSYLQQQMLTAVRPDILAAALRTLPIGMWQQPGEPEKLAVERLQKVLKVERVTTSYQLSISLDSPDPDAAAAIVNAVTNAYLAQGRKDENAVSSQRLQLLTQERQRIQSDLEQDRVEQAGLSGALGVANPSGELANPYDAQLSGVRTQLAAARAAHDLALAQLSSVHRGGQATGLASAADDLLQNDSGLSSMKTTINQRKAALSSQMAGLTPSNPVYKQDQDEIADLDRSLDTMTAQLRDKAEHRVEDRLGLELQRTASVEGMLNTQLARQTATATGAAPKLQRAAELAADVTRLTTRFGTVDDAIRTLELEANGPGMAHLSVAATAPLTPEPSKRKLLLLLALPLALLLGTAAAVLAHRRDPLVYTEKDLRKVLGFPPIGVLPSRDEVSRATVEEYVFRIAAGVETAYRVSSARSFVFTAASPSIVLTGFIGILQEKLEDLGFTVHVLEAGTLLQPGLTGGTAIPRQRAIAGTAYLALPHDPNREGYATANLVELKKNHDLVLIDAPPLIHSAATEYAMRCADAAILVAGSGVTQREELSQAAVLLDRLNVAGVGAVLKDLLLRHADASFKTAIDVLESRWAADASEASRAARSQRMAHHSARSTDDVRDDDADPSPEEAQEKTPFDVRDTNARGVEKDVYAKHHSATPIVTGVQGTQEWDGRFSGAPEEPVDSWSPDATYGTEHVGEPSEAFASPLSYEPKEPVNEVASAAPKQPPYDPQENGFRVDAETPKQAETSVTSPEEQSVAPQFKASLRPEGQTESQTQEETETSERARLWLQRLLNPGSVPESVAAPEAIGDPNRTESSEAKSFNPELQHAEGAEVSESPVHVTVEPKPVAMHLVEANERDVSTTSAPDEANHQVTDEAVLSGQGTLKGSRVELPGEAMERADGTLEAPQEPAETSLLERLSQLLKTHVTPSPVETPAHPEEAIHDGEESLQRKESIPEEPSFHTEPSPAEVSSAERLKQVLSPPATAEDVTHPEQKERASSAEQSIFMEEPASTEGVVSERDEPVEVSTFERLTQVLSTRDNPSLHDEAFIESQAVTVHETSPAVADSWDDSPAEEPAAEEPSATPELKASEVVGEAYHMHEAVLPPHAEPHDEAADAIPSAKEAFYREGTAAVTPLADEDLEAERPEAVKKGFFQRMAQALHLQKPDSSSVRESHTHEAEHAYRSQSIATSSEPPSITPGAKAKLVDEHEPQRAGSHPETSEVEEAAQPESRAHAVADLDPANDAHLTPRVLSQDGSAPQEHAQDEEIAFVEYPKSYEQSHFLSRAIEAEGAVAGETEDLIPDEERHEPTEREEIAIAERRLYPFASAYEASRAAERNGYHPQDLPDTIESEPEEVLAMHEPAFRASISGVRRAAELRRSSEAAHLAASRFSERSEGTIEPETGRMTRNWGMLSRFSGVAVAEEPIVETSSDRDGR